MVKTPALDALAASGVLFAQHYANTAPCGPSRASLLTGMYAMNHRSILNGTPLDARFDNIAKVARRSGYDPVLFGYTDTSVDPRTVEPNDPSLHNYEGVLPGFRPIVNDPELFGSVEWGKWLAEQGVDVPSSPADLYRPIENYPGADAHGDSWAPTQFSADHTETAFMMTKLIEWLEQHGDEQFFVHASFIRPHPPYRNPVGYHDLYSAEDVAPFIGHADRGDEVDMHVLNQVAIELTGVGCPTNELDRRQLRATYHAMQREVDDQLGRLFEFLRVTGLDAETLVVLTSDHGEMGGDHWLVQKLGYWDESYHIPLIIRDPRPEADATRGNHVAAFTESVDVMATICDWMGTDIPDQCDGRALTPFIDSGDTPADWRDAVHWQWSFNDPEHRMSERLLGLPAEHCSLDVVRTATTKYVQFAGDQALLPPLLFDLVDDPQQLHNVATSGDHLGEMLDGAQRLLRWRMQHGERTMSTYHLSAEQGLLHHADPRR